MSFWHSEGLEFLQHYYTYLHCTGIWPKQPLSFNCFSLDRDVQGASWKLGHVGWKRSRGYNCLVCLPSSPISVQMPQFNQPKCPLANGELKLSVPKSQCTRQGWAGPALVNSSRTLMCYLKAENTNRSEINFFALESLMMHWGRQIKINNGAKVLWERWAVSIPRAWGGLGVPQARCGDGERRGRRMQEVLPRPSSTIWWIKDK